MSDHTIVVIIEPPGKLVISEAESSVVSFSSWLFWFGSQIYCWIYMMVIDLFHLVCPGGKAFSINFTIKYNIFKSFNQNPLSDWGSYSVFLGSWIPFPPSNAFETLLNIFYASIEFLFIQLKCCYMNQFFSVKLDLWSCNKPICAQCSFLPTCFVWAIFCWRYLIWCFWETVVSYKFSFC